MKISVMSDLHFEYHADRGEGFLDALDPTDVDVLVLAGDICNAKDFEHLKKIANALIAKSPNVIYVPGNHEYYMSDHITVDINLQNLEMETPHNFHVIGYPQVRVIDGQRFLCGTMWYRRPEHVVTTRQRSMPDFIHIEGVDPYVYNQNSEFYELCEAEMRKGDVVVTHHLPCYRSVAPRFVLHPFNAFFLSESYALIQAKRPRLWIHGHTHDQVNYTIGPTQVVANPLGRPTEIASLEAFQDRLIIEVHPRKEEP